MEPVEIRKDLVDGLDRILGDFIIFGIKDEDQVAKAEMRRRLIGLLADASACDLNHYGCDLC